MEAPPHIFSVSDNAYQNMLTGEERSATSLAIYSAFKQKPSAFSAKCSSQRDKIQFPKINEEFNPTGEENNEASFLHVCVPVRS